MLTGRAAELRPDINYLAPRPMRLDMPQTPRTAMPGDFAQGLRLAGLNASLRAKRTRMAAEQAAAAKAEEQGRTWIPRSGSGRRRAKANRNREAVLAMADRPKLATGGPVDPGALYLVGEYGTDCYFPPFTVTRGRQYEGDLLPDDGVLGELRVLEAPDLLAEVLAWCSEHPATYPLDESGPLEMRRHADGTITVVGDAPDVLAISADLLALASRDHLTFNDGALTMNVQPEPLHYRPLGPDPRSRVVVFERIRED